MGLYQTMQTSTRLESGGIWLQVEDTRIKLGRAGGKNTKFIVAAEKLQRENKRALDLMSEEKGRKLFGKLYAEIIVLDWLTKSESGDLDEDGDVADEKLHKSARWVRGISGPDGSIMEFTVPKSPATIENILRVFDDIPDLLILVKQTCEDPALFRQDLLKDVEGNLSQS